MRSKTLYTFIVVIAILALVFTLTGCSSTTDKKDDPEPAFDAYRDMLIPMAQEKVDAGELTTRQADYIIYLSRQGKYPRGGTPSFSDALDNPPEVPADWDGPKEVKPAAESSGTPEQPQGEFDAYRDMLIPMAQEKVDAGELTARQADYIIYLSRQGKYPRGATPSFSDALENPPEVPADWDGPKEVKE